MALEIQTQSQAFRRESRATDHVIREYIGTYLGEISSRGQKRSRCSIKASPKKGQFDSMLHINLNG